MGSNPGYILKSFLPFFYTILFHFQKFSLKMGSNIGPHRIDVMFEPVLLEKCPSITELRKTDENFCIRPLQSDDFNHGFFEVLGQLTSIGKVTETSFKSQFKKMKSSNGTYYPTVMVDHSTGDLFLHCHEKTIESKN